MYLKKMTIKNFRKFGEKDNTIDFVTPYTERKFKSPTHRKSIAKATTLIVGKNNSGKTTITAALSHAILSEKISGSKFNYHYLERIFNSYFIFNDPSKNLNTPTMEFVFYIGLDAYHHPVNINNLSSFIKVDNINSRTIKVSVCYEVKENRLYTSTILNYINEWKRQNLTREEMFRSFILVISNEIEFVKKTYDLDGNEVANFRLSDLIDLKVIKANLEDNNRTLSSIFNKIVQYNLNLPAQKIEKTKITDELHKINKEITQMIGERHNKIVNNVVSEITDRSNMRVHLQADMNFNNTFNKIINYEFKENNHFIPEDQFGLGYTNLMKILGQLIDYIEHYEVDDSFSKVNIICVEEPENYMHPQMQELFINNIDTALDLLLSKTNKKINSQLLLTTHSSHILNSKVHNSGTFDNLNYIFTSSDKCAKVISLRDQKIANFNNENNPDKISKEELSFLKTHIKFKVSDLFFSDAIILVEGITEEQILKYYLSIDPFFNKTAISIFNINGAFAHVYKRLLDILGIPCLAITDLDIKRTKEEKASFLQLTSLTEKSTTNAVIKKYICLTSELQDEDEDEDEDESPAKLPSNLEYYIDEVHGLFKLVYQKKPINGYYASSFEEAFILKNYNKIILNKTLKTIKPRIFKKTIKSNGRSNLKNNLSQSYKWQKKLSSNKSEFANTLLYYILSTDYARPDLPDYILDGLTWLKKKINFLRRS